LGFYITAELNEKLLERLAGAIVASKDIDNQLIINDREAEINPIKRQKLTTAIRALDSFKQYCANGGRDISSARANVQLWLLNLLSTTIEITNNKVKLEIITKLTANPNSRIGDLNMLPDDKKQLYDELKRS